MTKVAPVVLATLSLCERLVRRAVLPVDASAQVDATDDTEIQVLLAAALGVVGAARASFAPTALRNSFCAASAVSAFRSMLRVLALLQQLAAGNGSDAAPECVNCEGASNGASIRNIAARALLELPPLLASLIDALDVTVQVVAWVRLASELLTEAPHNGPFGGMDAAATRRWAVRFCMRCLERCIALLPSNGPEFPAWEVLSELSRLYAQSAALAPASFAHSTSALPSPYPSLSPNPSPLPLPSIVPASSTCDVDAALAADCAEWCRALEAASVVVARRQPAQTREYLLLASCAGTPLPATLESLLKRCCD